MALVLNGDGNLTGLTAGGLPDATITQADLAANVVGNGPAFIATASGNQSVTADVSSKLNFNTVSTNLNSNYNASTYRFLPTVAGYYQINATAQIQSVNTSCVGLCSIFKNGAVHNYGNSVPATTNNYPMCGVSSLVYLNGSTDYVEAYIISVAVSTTAVGWNFQGVLVRAA